ncbi:helix-turn-helix transcriptional regulator [Amycolatopsis sp. 195334CR]|uniref:helix-turn-helix domain-containing protein n=1 Tax=Amycolatopsis sp. 195334CR TaxID=2814588 RepID=UPI001A8E4A25|nr:helix-turn-helix transcriptional regulator [Amycolatopsis sp. 195334CR]MBN6035277.1 helix-turn-helix domain-containing protein [Amycolatopsis sp. 195334CR]
MATIQGPVIPRRRIAEHLRRLREEAGRTLEEVASELLISTSKLSRLENAQGSPQSRDVRDLIRLYGIEGTELADKLMRWARNAGKQGWWADYSQTLPSGLDSHIAYETEASVARVYTIPMLPVLLQTPAYIRAIYRSAEPWWSDHDIEELLKVRLLRQSALTSRENQPPLKLIAITHESSVHQLVGTKEIMREQLDHLVERSTEPNIEFRIFPFSSPPLFTSTCMYAYFEYSDAMDRDVVNVETHAGFRYIETTEQVGQYRRYYEDLYNHSLPPEETRALIRSVQEKLFS